ncbi:MAG: PEGA domain-containing protein [Candidatus Omnitrophica bacterium]|nr:PEGA domain-containing protein [Candidatus Omnitrophota bacterium]
MLKCLKLTAVMVVVIFLSGCATIMTGATQKVSVNSNPSGAVAKVDGGMAAITPTIFNLERKTDHTIEISKEGYRVTTVILRHTMSGATAGNVLVGGIIGIAVDGCSGAMYKLVPERVDVNLEPAGQQVSADVPKAIEVPKPIEISTQSK